MNGRLPLYFSKPVLRHLTHVVDRMSSIGFKGKLTEIHAFSHQQKHGPPWTISKIRAAKHLCRCTCITCTGRHDCPKKQRLSHGQHAYPYDFRIFDKETADSKIQLSLDRVICVFLNAHLR